MIFSLPLFSYVRFFSIIMAIDFMVMMIAGMFDILPTADVATTSNLYFLIVTFVTIILHALYRMGFILALRTTAPKDCQLMPISSGLLRILIFNLYFQAMFFFFIMIVALMGITAGITNPVLYWVVMRALQYINFLMLLFWLDGGVNFRDFCRSFERAVNLFFYNIHYMLVIGGIAYVLNTVVQRVFGIMPDIAFGMVLVERFSVLTNFFIKHGVLILDLIPLILLFVLYLYKKDEEYTTFIF